MSELDQSSLGSLHDAARTRDAELAAFIGEREREGLPRNYRMRADAHYVDQLDRSQAGPVVRLIATRHIDAGDELPPAVSLSSLSQSIATHGMLQPLLVRRAGSRYQLIAGRKRLAAAVGGGMTDVPCIIHEVSESGAQAIAEAERVPTSAVEPVETKSDESAAVFPALSQDLARIGSLVDVLELASHPFQQRTAADFLKAEAWRAAWLANAAAILSNASSTSRILTVGRALDRVRNGFEPEMRLAKLQLEMSTAPGAADISCDERFGHDRDRLDSRHAVVDARLRVAAYRSARRRSVAADAETADRAASGARASARQHDRAGRRPDRDDRIRLRAGIRGQRGRHPRHRSGGPARRADPAGVHHSLAQRPPRLVGRGADVCRPVAGDFRAFPPAVAAQSSAVFVHEMSGFVRHLMPSARTSFHELAHITEMAARAPQFGERAGNRRLRDRPCVPD